MKPIDEKREEERKILEKADFNTRHPHTVKYVEKKLIDKGIQRQERHPSDGIGIGRPPHKSGHGGKFTWEGPTHVVDNELMAAPPAIDEGDPNYVDAEEKEDDVAEVVVGEIDVAKVTEEREGVARVDIDPRLQVN